MSDYFLYFFFSIVVENKKKTEELLGREAVRQTGRVENKDL